MADNIGNNGIIYITLSILLKNIEIEWNSKKYQISYMNHIINLMIQEFIKFIKIMINDKDNDKIERELQEKEDNIITTSFMKIIYKIQIITKIQFKIIIL